MAYCVKFYVTRKQDFRRNERKSTDVKLCPQYCTYVIECILSPEILYNRYHIQAECEL